MQALESVGCEAPDAGVRLFDGRSDALEPAGDDLLCVSHAPGVGDEELQLGTAGEGLAHPQTRNDSEHRGRRGTEPDHRRVARLWGQSDGEVEGAPCGVERHSEGEERDDHGEDGHRGSPS